MIIVQNDLKKENIKNASMNAAIEYIKKLKEIQNTPTVGHFFYDEINNELYGVHSTFALGVEFMFSKRLNKNIKTINYSHKSIWLKGIKGNKDDRLIKDYNNLHKGSVIQVENEGFYIFINKWMIRYHNVIDLVKFEFNLGYKVKVKIIDDE